jgi:hypothetical protein
VTTDIAASPDDQVPHLSRLGVGLFVVAASVIPLAFALYTNHIWEDYFITFRHSQNLCEGHGLVFQPGEVVHGFTSPLGTLLPAVGYWVTGGGSYMAALWFFRILSIGAFVGGGVLLLWAMANDGAPRGALIGLGVMYVLDAKAVDFAINGMETAFMLLFVAWAVYLFQKDVAKHWPALGLSWAGLLWTRPDGCIYISLLSLATLAFYQGTRKECLMAFVKSGLVCAFVYLPWFVWAWSYYGSPIPHTIIAKSQYSAGESAGHFFTRLVTFYPQLSADVFRPSYFQMGGWPEFMSATTQLLGLCCALYWVLPTPDRVGRMASLSFALLTVYLTALAFPYPWYMPPVAMLGLVVLTKGLFAYVDLFRKSPAASMAAAGLALALLIGERIWVFGSAAWQIHVHQAEVETGNREAVGHWLKDHVGAAERVYLEPSGYLGYFSGSKLLDYPGLVSPEVAQVIRHGHREFCEIGLYLKPEWMVLRPSDVSKMTTQHAFAREYRLVQEFDVRDKLGKYSWLPGRPYVEMDAAFQIYRRAD